ncbi:MAG: LysM peptidoglycan-binding domain-containing protein [Amylibacter sp.]
MAKIICKFLYTSLILLSFALLAACDGNTTLTSINDKIDKPPALPKTKTFERPAADDNGVITYPNYQIAVAKKYDTVRSMANRVGIPTEKLASYNGLKPQATLREGEILAIPTGEVLSSTGAIEDIATFALDSAPSATTQIQEGDEPVRHTVQSGETAQSIAALYNVSVTELSSWNGLDSELSVRNGQQLLIPTSNNLSEELSQTKSTTEVNDTENSNSENDNKIMNPTNNNIGKMIRPVNGKIIRNFSNKSGGSEGIDYEVAEGTKVKAAAKGTVALVSKSVGDTTIVLLRHDNNIYTVYSNITDVELTRDIYVEAGEIIGLVASGDPSFVHFEVRKGTQAVDPTPYLTQY